MNGILQKKLPFSLMNIKPTKVTFMVTNDKLHDN